MRLRIEFLDRRRYRNAYYYYYHYYSFLSKNLLLFCHGCFLEAVYHIMSELGLIKTSIINLTFDPAM